MAAALVYAKTTKKLYFTIMDFKGATQLFTDPDLDGKPVVIYEPSLEDPVVPPDIVTPLRVDAPEPLPYDLCLTDKTSGSSG